MKIVFARWLKSAAMEAAKERFPEEMSVRAYILAVWHGMLRAKMASLKIWKPSGMDARVLCGRCMGMPDSNVSVLDFAADGYFDAVKADDEIVGGMAHYRGNRFDRDEIDFLFLGGKELMIVVPHGFP